jgi:hypothetical protein
MNWGLIRKGNKMEYYSKENCIVGMVYKVFSRNLSKAVWNGKSFVGIREKFGDKFLFAEYHWDDGPPYGTVKPEEELGLVPEDMLLVEMIGCKDFITGRFTYFDETPDENGNGKQYTSDGTYKVKGHCFKDTGEIIQGKSDIRWIENEELFNYLDELGFD